MRVWWLMSHVWCRSLMYRSGKILAPVTKLATSIADLDLGRGDRGQLGVCTRVQSKDRTGSSVFFLQRCSSLDGMLRRSDRSAFVY